MSLGKDSKALKPGRLSGLAFKIPFLFLAMLLIMLGAFLAVMNNYGEPLLRDLAKSQLRDKGESIVSSMSERVAFTSALVTSLAHVAQTLPKQVALSQPSFKALIDYPGTHSFIAGGGVWPEPFAFDAKQARRSFFWGRDEQNTLHYFEDYNDPKGTGYHQEEWYVPVRHIEPGQVYWSRSYMDPYSFQSMVTASAPIYRDGQFYGVATIDLKLEGLSELLAQESKTFGGYAYAIDRNGTFLSYPNEAIAKKIVLNANGKPEVQYLSVQEAAKQTPTFPFIETALERTEGLSRQTDTLAKKALALASDSYQIDENEAHRIMSMLANPLKNKSLGNTFIREQRFSDDPILHTQVLVNAFHVPNTYWKVITVMPESIVSKSSDQITEAVVTSFMYVIAVGLFIGLLLLHLILIRPLHSMIDQVTAEEGQLGKIEGINGGELGVLSQQLNERSQALTEANRSLEASMDMTKQAVLAKSQFLANMSHEIRTPMNGVIGMLDLLLLGDLENHQKHYAEVAKSSADSLLLLINDILDFSKIEAGKLELEELDFNLTDLLTDFAGTMAHLAQKKGLDFVVDLSEMQYQWVKGDPNRFRQVFTNLVSNAIKFTDEGEVVLKVGVKDANGMGVIVFASVSDTGIGIPMGKQKILFDSFSQVDASTTRQYGGTGLGLAICKQLCDMMGGSISVRSEVGKGSCFELVITLEHSHEGQAEHLSLEGKRALLFEPNQSAAEVMRKLLQGWGCEVYCAQSLEDATNVLLNQSLSLAYVDVVTDHDSALLILKRFNEDESLEHIRAIALTSFLNENDDDYFREIGARGYIIKPVLPSKLVEVTRRVLAQAHHGMHSLIERERMTSSDSAPLRARILLVEDNVVNQEVAVGLLQEIGYTVDVADNGWEALQAIKDCQHSHPFHLVIMDCQMPVMDGYEATRKIRTGANGVGQRNIPIIAMTANAMKGDEEKCLAAGMDDYMSKPISLTILKEKLEKWLQDI